jgi:tetratricopeptide (TPR) repeat protein
MSLGQLTEFLDRGINSTTRKTPADAALERADALLELKPAEAVAEYKETLRVAPGNWPRRELAQASLAVALQDSKQWQQCAETAASDARAMARDAQFSRTVMAGMWCLVQGDPALWSAAAAEKLVPLAKEALASSNTVRDHRDGLYRTLMYLSLSRNDKAQAAKWGDKWLAELDAIKPADDDERTAVDIARVEAVQTYGDPERILPTLHASEKAMPHNYNASLRVAQMESEAKDYDAAIAACDRGVARQPGALTRSWLLQTKADALKQKGQLAEAHRMLEKALQAAEEIPSPQSRENNVKRIRLALDGS